MPKADLFAQGDIFARHLLIPADWLPDDWEMLPPDQVADLCAAPILVVEGHLVPLARRQL